MLQPGDTFGSYRVLRTLGAGGMGAVFLLEGASGVQVAAKILDPAEARDHESRKRFLREAELALGVKHPNLVEVYDVGEDPDSGFCYILMEYVSGGTLAEYLRSHGALSIEDAVAVVQGIAQVLELARQKGIVHRDIKPSNIMFAADGTPKLADLGIARSGSAGLETTVTQTGMVIGTPAYMAPEQMLDAHNVDTRADIYSLGIVFFEMLTGERPNKDDTVVQLMAKAMRGDPLPDVRTRRPAVPASLAKLIATMVALDRERRMATPAQLLCALDALDRDGLSWARLVRMVSVRKFLLPACAVLAGLAVACVFPLLKGDPPSRRHQAPPHASPPVAPPSEQPIHVDVMPIEPPPIQTNDHSCAEESADSCRTNAVAPQIPLPPASNLTQVVSQEVSSAQTEIREEKPAEVKEEKPVRPRPEKAVEAISVARTKSEVIFILKKTKLAKLDASPQKSLLRVIAEIRAALKQRVNFCVMCPPEKPSSGYRFYTKNVLAWNALESLCKMSGCHFEVHDNVVCIAPLGHEFRWKSAVSDKDAASARATLSELRLENLKLRSSHRIGDALEAFRRKTDAECPDEGIRWVDGHSAEDHLSDLRPMRLEDVSVWTALELLCNSVGWDFDCKSKMIVLHPPAGKSEAGRAGVSRFSRLDVSRMQSSDGEQAMRRSIDVMFPGWRLCRSHHSGPFGMSARRDWPKDKAPGYVAEFGGKTDVLRTCGLGDLMEYAFDRPVGSGRILCLNVSGDPNTQILVKVNGTQTLKDCGTLDVSGWRFYEIDLSQLEGKRPTLTIVVRGREPCVMQWHEIAVR